MVVSGGFPESLESLKPLEFLGHGHPPLRMLRQEEAEAKEAEVEEAERT